jgi:hypothetical protein
VNIQVSNLEFGFGARQSKVCPSTSPRILLLHALAQGLFEVQRSTMLLQEVAEGFVGEFLKVHHPITSEHVEGVQSLVVELNSLAGHYLPTSHSWSMFRGQMYNPSMDDASEHDRPTAKQYWDEAAAGITCYQDDVSDGGNLRHSLREPLYDCSRRAHA